MKTHAHRLAHKFGMRGRRQTRPLYGTYRQSSRALQGLLFGRVGPVGRKSATLVRPNAAVAGEAASFFEQPRRFFERAIRARGGGVGRTVVETPVATLRPAVYRRVYLTTAPGGVRRRGTTIAAAPGRARRTRRRGR